MVTANFYSLTFIVTVFFLSPWAKAINLSPCSKPKHQNFKNIIKVAIVDRDSRQTYADYAASKGVPLETINEKYGATGVINCDGTRATAQVTGNSGVITTSAHIFFDKKCKRETKKGCQFAILENGKESKIRVDLNSLILGGCDPESVETDWAVLKLSRPVAKTISPYKLPEPGFRIQKNLEVTQASGISSTFFDGKRQPRHLTDCHIKDPALFNGYPIQTDCDSGHGSSGSAQLIETQNSMTVVAIVSDSVGQRDGTPYDSQKSFNLSTPVRGAFLEAIKSAVAETGGAN